MKSYPKVIDEINVKETIIKRAVRENECPKNAIKDYYSK
jgi:hypothetical protein